MDQRAEKYYGMTHFNGMGNNPILFSDMNGDSISLNLFQMVDKALGTNYAQQVTNQLSEITGLNISIGSDGFLNYKKETVETPLIGVTLEQAAVTEIGGVKKGSETARNYLKGLIDSKDAISVSLRPGGRSVTGGNSIGLDPNQITDFVEGTPSGLNKNTLGMGMILLHELNHTTAGGNLSDPANRADRTSTGPVVDKVNIYRSELDSNPLHAGNPYGQRMHYNAIPSSSGSGASVKFQVTKPKVKSLYVKF